MASSADKQENGAILTSVKTIAALIKGLFIPSTPPIPIDKVTLRTGVVWREGLSKSDLWADIQNTKSKMGIPIGPLPSGARNIDNIVEKIRVDKTIETIMTKAKVEVVIPEGAILTRVKGITADGIPVTGVAQNDIPIAGISKGSGIIR
tara:strand:- start:320 stop:766 length:447 start_codon:yes stop_codon:yes gene_type:complete